MSYSAATRIGVSLPRRAGERNRSESLRLERLERTDAAWLITQLAARTASASGRRDRAWFRLRKPAARRATELCAAVAERVSSPRVQASTAIWLVPADPSVVR